jgi:hypothetical protein
MRQRAGRIVPNLLGNPRKAKGMAMARFRRQLCSSRSPCAWPPRPVAGIPFDQYRRIPCRFWRQTPRCFLVRFIRDAN